MEQHGSGDAEILTPLDLTIAIPVRNEERNLAICLPAISNDFARQVVVIDSCSTDATAAVARAHGAELIPFTWNGHFPKKRNWFLRHHRPNTEWVLFLDADEILTPAVKWGIAAALFHCNIYHCFLMSFALVGGS